MIKPTNWIAALAAIFNFAQGENLLDAIDHTRDLRAVYSAFDDQVAVGCEERVCISGHFDSILCDCVNDSGDIIDAVASPCMRTCDEGSYLDTSTCDCVELPDIDFDLAASPCMRTCDEGSYLDTSTCDCVELPDIDFKLATGCYITCPSG